MRRVVRDEAGGVRKAQLMQGVLSWLRSMEFVLRAMGNH